jgi:MFS family permease
MNTSEAPDTLTLPDTGRHPLINHNFALLWSGQTISMFGDFIFNTTLLVWIAVVLTKGQTWTPLAVSGIVLASSLPTVLLGPVAGVFVDRWNKRLALAWASLLPAVFIGLLLLQISIAGSRLIGFAWQLSFIYLVVFLISGCNQVARPAWMALTERIVAKADQPRALGLDQGSASLGMLLGPALAPPLLLTLGPQWALLVNLASFLVATLTILLIRVPEATQAETRTARAPFLVELREGVAFLSRHTLLRTMLILLMIASLSAGALNALDIFFVTNNLHTPPALYGVLDVALGMGTILGAVLASALGDRLGLTRVLQGSVLALGLGVLIYARLTSFTPALLLIFLIGVPLAMLSVVTGPLILRATPQHLLGRVTSLFNPSATLAMLVGAAVAGAMDSALATRLQGSFAGLSFGAVDSIFTVAGLLLLISGLYAMLSFRKKR